MSSQVYRGGVIGKWTDAIIESGPVKAVVMFNWLAETAVFVLVMIELTMARAFNDWSYQWVTFFGIIGFLSVVLLIVGLYEQGNRKSVDFASEAKKLGLNAVLQRAALGIIFMAVVAAWSGVIEKKLELNDTHRVAFENNRYDSTLPANMDMRYYIRFQMSLAFYAVYWSLSTLHYVVYIGFRMPVALVGNSKL